jgi:hypothetical protein
MLRSELKRVKILSELSIKRQRRHNLLIGRFITVAGAPLFQQRATMSQQEGDSKEVGYEHAYEYNEDESEGKSDNNVAVVKPMNSIWECEHLCIKTQEGIRGGIHKKISVLKKKVKKVPHVFFKIIVRGPKQKLGRGADAPPLSPPLPPSSPILSIPFSLEIDPLGIYRLTFLRHARGS